MASMKRVWWRTGGAWLGRAFRVTLGLSVVAVGVGAVAARVSYARAAEAGLDFGEELRQMGEHHLSGDLSGDVYQIALNGQPFDSSNVPTGRSVKEVLDYFQDQCSHNGDGLGDELSRLSKTLGELPKAAGHPGFLVVRKDAGDRGFVFCMAADHELSVAEKTMRFSKVAQSGDFGQLGDMRYISVIKDPVGSSVQSLWTHGSFSVNAMFPKVGDAPGEDLGGAPRPEGARRVLTGMVVGAPFGVNAYEVPGGKEQTMDGIEAKFVAAGYKPVTFPDVVPAKSRFYSLPGGAMDVGVNARAGRQGTTTVSYIVSRGLGKISR